GRAGGGGGLGGGGSMASADEVSGGVADRAEVGSKAEVGVTGTGGAPAGAAPPRAESSPTDRGDGELLGELGMRRLAGLGCLVFGLLSIAYVVLKARGAKKRAEANAAEGRPTTG